MAKPPVDFTQYIINHREIFIDPLVSAMGRTRTGRAGNDRPGMKDINLQDVLSRRTAAAYFLVEIQEPGKRVMPADAHKAALCAIKKILPCAQSDPCGCGGQLHTSAQVLKAKLVEAALKEGKTEKTEREREEKRHKDGKMLVSASEDAEAEDAEKHWREITDFEGKQYVNNATAVLDGMQNTVPSDEEIEKFAVPSKKDREEVAEEDLGPSAPCLPVASLEDLSDKDMGDLFELAEEDLEELAKLAEEAMEPSETCEQMEDADEGEEDITEAEKTGKSKKRARKEGESEDLKRAKPAKSEAGEKSKE